MHTPWQHAQITLCVVGVLVVGSVWPNASFGANPSGRTVEERRLDCQYESDNGAGDSPVRHLLLPADDLFRPPLADAREPRFYAGYRFVQIDAPLDEDDGNEAFNGASVGLGETFGLWSMRRAGTCRGVQIGLLAGVFSHFNLDTVSADLLNSDYRVGLQATGRWGMLSARLRIHHQSSHLGDEFLLGNPDFERLDLNMETVDLLVSVQTEVLRAYGGGGYIYHAIPSSIARGKLQGGLEVRGPTWRTGRLFRDGTMTWLGGLDVSSYEVRDWGLTLDARGGLELAADETNRRMRAHAVFATGYLPSGQFFQERTSTSVGFEAQFAF